MKIEVFKIPDQGLDLEERLSGQDLELDADMGECAQPVFLRAHVSRINNAVKVRVGIQADFRAQCSRCLAAVNLNLDKTVDLDFWVDNPQGVIDLNPCVREELILAYPFQVICRPDCRGICPQCGKNKNKERCDCF